MSIFLYNNKLYRIATLMNETISPEVLKIESGPFTLAMSNIAEANTAIDVPEIISTYSIRNNSIIVSCNTNVNKACIELISSQGTTLFSTIANGSEFSIPCDELAKGVYFVSIITNNKSVQTPVIIE